MKTDDPRVAENLAELAEILARMTDAGLVGIFFRLILTPAERADIAGRWALVKALDRKIPQREIARDLGVSLCKITRGSRELKNYGPAFGQMLALAEKSPPVEKSLHPGGSL